MNFRSLIQLLETLLVKLTETHIYLFKKNNLLKELRGKPHPQQKKKKMYITYIFI